MDVKKIFITLIIVVACVMIGALILNTLMPNVTKSLVNSVEQMVFNATGMQFDWNGDGTGGSTGAGTDFTAADYDIDAAGGNLNGDAVEGFDNAA